MTSKQALGLTMNELAEVNAEHVTTISKLEQKIADMAVQLANAESKCRELSSKAMELEARTVKLPTGTEVNGFQMLIEEEVIARLRESGINPIVVRAAGIGVKGE